MVYIDEAAESERWLDAYSTRSQNDVYGNVREEMEEVGRYLRYAPSTDSLLHLIETKHRRQHHTGLGGSAGSNLSNDTLVNSSSHAAFPAWSATCSVPIDQIQSVFVQLTNRFGFQHDSMQNMYEHLLTMLDSRSSRMPGTKALQSLHAEYIGGPHANYRKWFFAAQLDLDEAVGDQHAATHVAEDNQHHDNRHTDEGLALQSAEETWRLRMESLTDLERIRQIALWLLIWAEAANVRFCPEALCFIFKCAKDHDDAITQETLIAEGDFLDHVIAPIYTFVRDESYDKQGIHRERDHADTIGYDDVNQLFWYPERINRIVLRKQEGRRIRLTDLAPHERYMQLRNVEWSRVFQKTFKEKRSWMHLAINFTRIWIIHVVAFWYYIAANADSIYLSEDKEQAAMETPVKLSVVALGGGIATLLVMLASTVEYVYVPLSWRRAGILSRRLALLIPILLVNVGPSIYCIRFDRTSKIAMIVAVVQLLISIATSIFFAVIPQSRLFVRFRKNSRKSLASQTFTANFPHLKRMDRLMSIGLWLCVFSCKLIESYFFLALSFKDPLTVMARMRVQNCSDPYLGTGLCTYMPTVTLVFMFLMELILFFLDTYLWYIIWNTVFSVARSFYLGISIWTPWRNMFSRLPKRIYAKILASSEFEVQYKPKFLCSQIWNAFIIAMYREHLLSSDHVGKLLYQQVKFFFFKKKRNMPGLVQLIRMALRYQVVMMKENVL